MVGAKKVAVSKVSKDASQEDIREIARKMSEELIAERRKNGR